MRKNKLEQIELVEPPAADTYNPLTTVLEVDSEQADAVYLLRHARIGVITGGPGRGKTRVIQAALPLLGNSIALCAPSGKAARRMAELTGHPASTVHRLLGLLPGTNTSVFNASNPLPYDVVIVDEASTLDNYLGAKLLGACDVRRTRVFFVGDVDQLPSVGAGQVLMDLLESDAVPVVRLETMHRSAQESWICRTGPEVLEGRIDLKQCKDFAHIAADDDLVGKTVGVVKELVRVFARDDVQTVVPMNVGPYGAQVLNTELQEALNPGDGASFSAGKGARVRTGDSVVVVNNDYEKAVFNGETGTVKYIEAGRNGEVIVDFYDREVQYDKAGASEALRLAYALSVHKMQGSEVRWVVLALHEGHGPLLSRKLLYTAITRAKEGVIIVGQKSAIQRAVSVADTTRRCTMLRKRIVDLRQPR